MSEPTENGKSLPAELTGFEAVSHKGSAQWRRESGELHTRVAWQESERHWYVTVQVTSRPDVDELGGWPHADWASVEVGAYAFVRCDWFDDNSDARLVAMVAALERRVRAAALIGSKDDVRVSLARLLKAAGECDAALSVAGLLGLPEGRTRRRARAQRRTT